MHPERLQEIKDVLDEALLLDPAERPDFLDRVCRDDDVRREVESLLEQEARDTPPLERPLFSLRPEGEVADRPQPGDRIGAYEIVRKIGEGGMGTVFLARREADFQKEVALKLIRADLAAGSARRRFEKERQFLARLDHPDIARILDGGTTADGRPYLVMDYIEGEPIDLYCASRDLPLRERLELFRRVCSAVGEAHRHLVVHRDLKPSNILVSAEGVPKLLDFGIAKQLADSGTPASRLTLLRQPMTLRYASPEQIEGEAITTASDVFSLGVLLYHLLTRCFPHLPEGSSEVALARAICEAEPRRPSAAARGERLDGDLDSILLKALRKDPRKRYSSVGQLSADIGRYLEGRPVLSREGTVGYRAGKFVRRHKLPLAAAVLLLLGFVASVTSWRQAVRERELRHEFVTFLDLLFLHSSSDVSLGGGLPASGALAHVEERLDELEVEAPLRADIFESMSRIFSERGLYAEARSPLEKAVALRRLHPEDAPKLARTINNLAVFHYRLGNEDEAERLYREALEMKRDLGEGADVVKTMSNLATIMMNRGRFARAEELYREALEIRRKVYGPGDPDVGISLRHLGNLFYVRGELAQAEPLLRRALEVLEQVRGEDHPQVAHVLSSLGRVLQAQGRYPESKQLYLRCLRIRLSRYGEDHLHVAVTHRDLAAIHLDLGDPEAAQDNLDQALSVIAESRNPRELAETESLLGALRTRQGRHVEARGLLTRSYEALRQHRGAEAVHSKRALRRLHDLYAAWKRPVPARFIESGDRTATDNAPVPHAGSPPGENSAPGSGS